MTALGYLVNKPLPGLLDYRRIMPLAKRLSSNFTVALEALFIFWTIFQPRALSSDIPAAGSGLFILIISPGYPTLSLFF